MNWDKHITQMADKADRSHDPVLKSEYLQASALCSIAKSLESRNDDKITITGGDTRQEFVDKILKLYDRSIQADPEATIADYIRSEELLESDIKLLKEKITDKNNVISSLTDAVSRKDDVITYIDNYLSDLPDQMRSPEQRLDELENWIVNKILPAIEKERKS